VCELAMVQYDAAPKLMTLLLFIDFLSLSDASEKWQMKPLLLCATVKGK
jgi:hypothetical protein